MEHENISSIFDIDVDLLSAKIRKRLCFKVKIYSKAGSYLKNIYRNWKFKLGILQFQIKYC